MYGKRVLLAAATVSGMLGAFVACSDQLASSENVGANAETVKAASVSITVLNDAGQKVGSCAGVLIAPRAVLTAGHCITGKVKWQIEAASGAKSTANKGYTFDWTAQQHCETVSSKHDVGVISLDNAINLSAYPSLPSSGTNDGTPIRRSTRPAGLAQFEFPEGRVAKAINRPLFYTTSMPTTETLDTAARSSTAA